MKKETVDMKKLDFEKVGGLIPVITQDIESKKVLMHAYTDKQALKKTLTTGYAHYWSRSRKRIWKKGETSGNTQKLKRILVDCDNDTLLFLVDQKGNACHTGKPTCFYTTLKHRIE